MPSELKIILITLSCILLIMCLLSVLAALRISSLCDNYTLTKQKYKEVENISKKEDN